MVTEPVTIVIRERGAAATSRQIRGIGRVSRTATVAVTGLLGALAGFLTIRGIARLGTDAVNAAAGFEQFGIRIGALLGNQREANTAIENFVDLASQTPFSVSQIVEGASALGAAALGNRQALEELTQTAANLAAVTGLSFTEAAGNLQRALSGGIGAADLFRERGVRALIESIEGIPDATKLSREELDLAFRNVFGEGGVFGSAARDLSLTLGGALSNIGDAATNTRVALGDAFAPAVIGAARKAIIPFLENLQDLIENNQEEVTALAASTVRFLVPAFTNFVRVGLASIQAFQQIGEFATDLIGTYKQLTLAVSEAALAALEFASPFVDDDVLQVARASVAALRKEVDDYALGAEQGRQANAEFANGLDAINESLGELERNIANADLTTRPETGTDVDLPIGAGGVVESDEERTARENAEKRILRITNQLRVSTAARTDALEGQIVRLQQQAEELRAAATAAGDELLAREGLKLIDEQILAIREEQKANAAEEAAELAKEKAKLRGEQATEIGGGILQAIQTDGKSAIDLLGRQAEETFAQAIGDAVVGIEDALTEVFESAFGEVDFGGILGDNAGAIGSALSGAFAIGAQLLARELGGTSSSARNDLVRGSTESAQATRGVVAGPTSVPIFQIGQTIEAAFGTTEDLLRQLIQAVLAESASPGVAGGIGGAAADLSLGTASTA